MRKNIGENCCDLGLHQDFLDIIQKTQSIKKEKVDKLDHVEMKTFAMCMASLGELKYTDGEKYLKSRI